MEQANHSIAQSRIQTQLMHGWDHNLRYTLSYDPSRTIVYLPHYNDITTHVRRKLAFHTHISGASIHLRQFHPFSPLSGNTIIN